MMRNRRSKDGSGFGRFVELFLGRAKMLWNRLTTCGPASESPSAKTTAAPDIVSIAWA